MLGIKVLHRHTQIFWGEGSIDLTSGPWVLMLAESVLFPTELQFLMDELVYPGGLSSR